MAFCINCGQDTGEAKYCIHCGTNQQENNSTQAYVAQATDSTQGYAPLATDSTQEYAPQAADIAQEYVPQPTDNTQGYAPQPTDNSQGYAPQPYNNAQSYAPQPYNNAQGYATPPNSNYQGYNNSQQAYQPGYQGFGAYPRGPQNAGVYSAAFIFMIIGTILIGISTFCIGLAWCIPMTVHANKIKNGTKPNTTGFGVCCLLFVGLIAGILFLVTDKDM